MCGLNIHFRSWCFPRVAPPVGIRSSDFWGRDVTVQSSDICPSTSDPAVPPMLDRSRSSPAGCLFLAAPVPCGWLVLLLAPSLPRWNTGHIRDAGPRPNMRTRTPHFFTANTVPFGRTLTFWREEEPAAAAVNQVTSAYQSHSTGMRISTFNT